MLEVNADYLKKMEEVEEPKEKPVPKVSFSEVIYIKYFREEGTAMEVADE